MGCCSFLRELMASWRAYGVEVSTGFGITYLHFTSFVPYLSFRGVVSRCFHVSRSATLQFLSPGSSNLYVTL